MTRTALAVSVAVIGVTTASAPHAQAPARTRSVYVTALDQSGLPVAGLTAADVSIKEDDKPQPVVSVAPATQKMSIALMIDDSGLGISDFRVSVASFMTRLLGQAEFCLIATSGQNRTLVDFTEDEAALDKAMQGFTTRVGPLGQHLVEGVLSTLGLLEKKEAVRPVVVVLTNQMHESGNTPARPVMDKIGRAGATLYVVEVQQPAVQGLPTTRYDNLSDFSRANEEAEPDRVRLQVLSTGPPATGGRYQRIVASNGAPAAMRAIASELLSQYQIVFGSAARPDSAPKIALSTTRPGVTIRAPARAGGRPVR